jgi:hypothetical protein
MVNRFQACPLCNNPVDFSVIHPHYVCHSCITGATDEQGNEIVFFHARFVPGLLQGYYRNNTELVPFEGNTCFINGARCYATYDQVNGIIVQPFFEDLEKPELSFKSAPRKQFELSVLH